MASYTTVAGAVLNSGESKSDAGSSSYTVVADSYIVATIETAALHLEGNGVWTVKVEGGLFADIGMDNNVDDFNDGTGLELVNFGATANNKLSLGQEGGMAGSEVGIYATAAFDLVNAGIVSGGHFGIDLNGFAGGGTESNLNLAGKKILIDNKATGIIEAAGPWTVEHTGINNNSFAALTIKNAGDILGGFDIFYDEDLDDVDDDGFKGAAINTGGTLDLNNSKEGVIEGLIQTGWINTKIVNAGLIEGTVSSHIPRNGSGVVDLDHDGDFGDTLDGGAADVGTLNGVAVTNSGTLNGIEDFGSFQDVDDVDGDNDVVEFIYFQVALDLTRGKDSVINTGQINGDVLLNRGDDFFSNARKVTGNVHGGEGNDTMINKDRIRGDFNGGNGDDTMSNDGFIHGTVYLGDGNNTFTNKGEAMAGVYGGINNDKVTTSNEIDMGIFLGDGDDELINTGEIFGPIELGGGNDTFTGGKFAEVVTEEAGVDTYLMGDADDQIIVGGFDADVDTFDGGKGTADQIDFSAGAEGIVVDFATKTVTDNVGATDTILNFERVVGTGLSDEMKGTALAERFFGEGGNDELTGRGGRDVLLGGEGADTFVFEAVTDSGKTRGLRDEIRDFNMGDGDKLALYFDASSVLAGEQNFTALIENGSFTKSGSGELRYIWNAGTTIIEADTTGDGKADFSFVLFGIHNLDITNFQFDPM